MSKDLEASHPVTVCTIPRWSGQERVRMSDCRAGFLMGLGAGADAAEDDGAAAGVAGAAEVVADILVALSFLAAASA